MSSKRPVSSSSTTSSSSWSPATATAGGGASSSASPAKVGGEGSASAGSARVHPLSALVAPRALRTWSTFINQTEARDKVCKIIQYASRFVAWYTRDGVHASVSKRFEGLFVGMSQARKLFRLFKTLQEYQKLVDLFRQPSQEDSLNRVLSVIKQLGMMEYWGVENIGTLSKVGFLGFNPASFAKAATAGWFVALVAQLIKDARTLAGSFRLEKARGTTVGREEEKEKLQARKASVLSIIKTCGDLITASNGIELPLRLFGRQFSEGAVGLGGLTSAVLTCYSLWPAAPSGAGK